ncbi:sensor histidine kinase [Amycolatopsis sp. H6(2020)]|nr:sensor histidine kinase [Amycolatopsis sp. H6(2020)]
MAADVGLGVVLAAVLVFESARLAGSWGGNYWQFDLAAGTVVCAMALMRRRDLARAAIAGLTVAAVAVLVARSAQLPSQPGPAMALALSVLVAAAVRTLSPRPASAVAVAGLAVAAGSLLTVHGSSTLSLVVTVNGVGWSTAVAIGLLRRLRDIRRQATLEKVRRDERLELARELHDVVAHHITGVVLQTQAARITHRKHPEQLDASLTDIESAGSDALAAMRQVIGLLRDTDDAAPGWPGPEQLGDLVERFTRHGPPVHFQLPERKSVWPPEVTSTVYRIVQESLTNVSRHAPRARSVTVSVGEDRERVTVEVVDDAPASPARHRGGYGLVGLRERVEALDGTLSAGPGPSAGWSVRATLPVPAGAR